MRGHRPRGALRRLLRLPSLLYDCHAGWLLGGRFLRLSHTGRRTGRIHHTVLEVVGERGGEVVVMAGIGRRADWYRNLESGLPAEVAIGRRRFAARHRTLDEAEACDLLADYERRNRLVAPLLRVLSWLAGWRYDGGDEARRRLVRQLPLVGLRPVPDV